MSIDSRLQKVEADLTEVRVSQARTEERQVAMDQKLDHLVGQVRPLEQSAWKQRGATTVMGLIGGFVSAAAIAILRSWR